MSSPPAQTQNPPIKNFGDCSGSATIFSEFIVAQTVSCGKNETCFLYNLR